MDYTRFTDRLFLMNGIHFRSSPKKYLWMTIVDIIEQGHRKHIYNGTQDEGEYEESLSYREQLLNNILSISSTSNYYNDYEGFKNDYFNSLSTVARYCGYNIYLLPLMQYRDGITGNIVPEKVVIKVEEISFDKWNGKIKLTDDVITQRLIDNFILICKSAREYDKKYVAENIYEMCIIDPATAEYYWTVDIVQDFINKYVEGNMKVKVIDGQESFLENKNIDEMEVNNMITATGEGRRMRYPKEMQDYVVRLFMDKYFGQFILAHKENLTKENPATEDRRVWNKMIKSIMVDVTSKYPSYINKATAHTVRDWIKNIPEFDAIRPKSHKSKATQDVSVTNNNATDDMPNYIDATYGSSNTTVVLEDNKGITFTSVGTSVDDECIEEQPYEVTEFEIVKHVWNIRFNYIKVTGKWFKSAIELVYESKHIAENALDALKLAYSCLKETVDNTAKIAVMLDTLQFDDCGVVENTK